MYLFYLLILILPQVTINEDASYGAGSSTYLGPAMMCNFVFWKTDVFVSFAICEYCMFQSFVTSKGWVTPSHIQIWYHEYWGCSYVGQVQSGQDSLGGAWAEHQKHVPDRPLWFVSGSGGNHQEGWHLLQQRQYSLRNLSGCSFPIVPAARGCNVCPHCKYWNWKPPRWFEAIVCEATNIEWSGGASCPSPAAFEAGSDDKAAPVPKMAGASLGSLARATKPDRKAKQAVAKALALTEGPYSGPGGDLAMVWVGPPAIEDATASMSGRSHKSAGKDKQVMGLDADMKQVAEAHLSCSSGTSVKCLEALDPERFLLPPQDFNKYSAASTCTFSTSQLPKVVRSWGVLYLFTSKSASRHNGVQLFISHLPRCLRTRRFSEPTFRPSGAPNHWKNTVFRDFHTFSRICNCFLLTLSLLWSSLFYSLSSLCLFPALLFICPYCRKFDF